MERQPGLPKNERQKALGMVDAGMSVADIVARFDIHKVPV